MFQILLVTALCIDAFSASFAYGIDKTKIPIVSAAIISIVSTGFFALSLSIGTLAKQIIPANIANLICFIILLFLGLIKSFECFLKSYIIKKQKYVNPIEMKLFDIRFVLTVYADNIKADADDSKILSSKEALYLAVALSLDGFAAGFGGAMVDINILQIILLSLISNILAISLGYVLGKFITENSKLDFSWLGGVLLIILAFMKL